MITIRDQAVTDLAVIQAINAEAFGRPGGGSPLFDTFRATRQDIVSLVAERDGEMVGHILFSPATVDGTGVHGMGLGQLAVLPSSQNAGVGTALGREGIARLRARDCAFAIVVGHADYYPRFGFRPGSQLGLRCQWPRVPDANFMALILDGTVMAGVTGVARFDDVP